VERIARLGLLVLIGLLDTADAAASDRSGKIYYEAANSIRRANLDGSDQQQLLVGTPKGLDIDSEARGRRR
jgi:hypothetical protein